VLFRWYQRLRKVIEPQCICVTDNSPCKISIGGKTLSPMQGIVILISSPLSKWHNECHAEASCNDDAGWTRILVCCEIVRAEDEASFLSEGGGYPVREVFLGLAA
jgi:hypothetical protein